MIEGDDARAKAKLTFANPYTVNAYLRILKCVLLAAYRKYRDVVIASNGHKKIYRWLDIPPLIELEATEPRKVRFTFEQFSKWFTVIPEWLQKPIVVAASMGLRLDNWVKLQWVTVHPA